MPADSIMHKHHITLGGKPDADTALVFIHGFGTDQTAWQAIEPAFADRFRTVLFDNVGAGRSDPESFVQHRYLGLAGYARDLVELCDALRLRRVILVGHSIGAMIGMLAAIERPLLVARLVMIGASPHYLQKADYPGGLTEQDRDGIYRAVMSRTSELADLFAPLAFAGAERPDLVRAMADAIHAIPAEHVLTILCSILQSDHRTDLARLAQPVLLIQARSDAFVPQAVAEYLQTHLRHSTLRIIEADGHLPHISAPQAVLDAMHDFVHTGLTQVSA